MKKWGILLCVIIGLGLAIPQLLPIFQEKVDIRNSPQIGDNFKEIEVPLEQMHYGHLVLVNHEYPAHQEQISSDIVSLSQNSQLVMGFELLDQSIQFNPFSYQSLLQRNFQGWYMLPKKKESSIL